VYATTDMTPFQRFIVHLSSSMLLNENRGDTIDDIERLFKLADMAAPELYEHGVHDRLAELLGIDPASDLEEADGIGLYTDDIARITADLRMHDPGPFDACAAAVIPAKTNVNVAPPMTDARLLELRRRHYLYQMDADVVELFAEIERLRGSLVATFKTKCDDFGNSNHVDRGRFGQTHLTRPFATAGFRAVLIPSDQTIRYLTDSGEFTLNHAQARIFTDAEAAEQAARDVDGYTEFIGDLVEFRLREDTW
jgi:hypothetical protein